jgi:tetratricopeptide (TPR) repeat protein
MASHIYIRVGRYHDASRVNQEAIEQDRTLLAGDHAEGDYSQFLTRHNVHFLSATAALEGRAALSIASALELRSGIDATWMRTPGLETLQHFWATPIFHQVRFGKWDDILAYDRPAEDLVYPRGFLAYARGMALLRKDQPEEAAGELATLRQLKDDPRLDGLSIFGLNSMRTILDIATAVLAGEIAGRRGEISTAVAELERAVALEDGLTYDEPPPWHFPVRQAQGAVLLQAGRAAEAEKVYRADLDRFPHNGWSLFGLRQSLELQGKSAAAAEAATQFAAAWQHADVELTASRF